MLPTYCFTLSLGLCRGEVLLLRCAGCGTTYAGPWCWPTGGDAKTFPAGQHRPRAATNLSLLETRRWFFGTPQVCLEKNLLKLLLLLAARGGVSWTPLFVVYSSMFPSTLSGTQFVEHREHFVTAVEVAVMVWGALRLICGAHVDNDWEVEFHLRPHHKAEDFRGLLAATRRAWERTVSLHVCRLCTTFPGIIVDGKWCMQVSLCNDRSSGSVWNADLATGTIIGCTSRPQRGSKYCSQHHMQLGDQQAEVPQLQAHRQQTADTTVLLEYQDTSGAWLPAHQVPVASIRIYELQLLPTVGVKLGGQDVDPCSKDPRRGIGESYVSRKSGGLLVAVYPCMHIVGVQPMFSSESLTQVILFVWHILSYLTGLSWVVYDFACGAVRHIRTSSQKRQGKPAQEAWIKLLSLRWVVDKLHFFKGHTACKDESSRYYEPKVNPYAHKEIIGVDTEAAEQIFHIANRWQTNLSNSHVVNFDLQLILFSNEHNERNRCDLAWRKYVERQPTQLLPVPRTIRAPR